MIDGIPNWPIYFYQKDIIGSRSDGDGPGFALIWLMFIYFPNRKSMKYGESIVFFVVGPSSRNPSGPKTYVWLSKKWGYTFIILWDFNPG